VTPVVWTEAVLPQLAAIQDYISQTSPVYADRLIARVLARGKQLGEFPLAGRQVPERMDPTLREVIEWPYRVIYRVQPAQVEVLAVVHGRRLDAVPGKPAQ
jgi:toxin ParE1/3/4